MAVVQVNENTLDFIFDDSVNNYPPTGTDVELVKINENTKIYAYNLNNELIDTNLAGLYALIGFKFNGNKENDINFIGCGPIVKYEEDYTENEIMNNFTFLANEWYCAINEADNIIPIRAKGIRIENFTYAEGQTLETINELVNPYIGTKTSFAKTYTLRVNGKTLNTLNGKKIRNLIYNGTTYEIAEPVVAEYSLTFENTSNLKFPNNLELPTSIKAGQTIDINWYTLWKPGPFFKIEGINCNARWFTTTDGFSNSYFHIEVSNATGDAVVKIYDGDLI